MARGNKSAATIRRRHYMSPALREIMIRHKSVSAIDNLDSDDDDIEYFDSEVGKLMFISLSLMLSCCVCVCRLKKKSSVYCFGNALNTGGSNLWSNMLLLDHRGALACCKNNS